jgi:hypothetical protein
VPGDQVQPLAMLCDIAGIKPIVLGADRPKPIWELMG